MILILTVKDITKIGYHKTIVQLDGASASLLLTIPAAVAGPDSPFRVGARFSVDMKKFEERAKERTKENEALANMMDEGATDPLEGV